MTTLQLMLARHAVEIAECPSEHAMEVAEKHMNESFAMQNAEIGATAARLKAYANRRYGQDA